MERMRNARIIREDFEKDCTDIRAALLTVHRMMHTARSKDIDGAAAGMTWATVSENRLGLGTGKAGEGIARGCGSTIERARGICGAFWPRCDCHDRLRLLSSLSSSSTVATLSPTTTISHSTHLRGGVDAHVIDAERVLDEKSS